MSKHFAALTYQGKELTFEMSGGVYPPFLSYDGSAIKNHAPNLPSQKLKGVAYFQRADGRSRIKGDDLYQTYLELPA